MSRPSLIQDTSLSANISSLTLSSSGSLTGSTIAAGSTIPLSYHFSLGITSGSIGSWLLTFTLGSSSGGSGSQTINGSGAGDFSGATSLLSPLIATGDTASLSAFIQVDWNPLFVSDTLSIDVPQNSLDFNSDTPEPASLALFGSGLAFLGWRLVRDRRRGRNGFALFRAR